MAAKENILKRTRFCIVRPDGARDYTHFAQSIVSLDGGPVTMVEPFTPEMMGMSTTTAFDPRDDAIRVDEEVSIVNGREQACLIGNDQMDLVAGGQALHGGVCWLRG